MEKIIKRLPIIISVMLFFTWNGYAQKDRKVTFVGGARSVMTNSKLIVTDTAGIDTATAKRNTGGYALIDLGVNIKPNKNTEILGMFRIRNGFGGFWGSGVAFDVRQLYMKGIVANVLRYQLGDLNLKQTPFTLYNHHADAIDSLPDIFNLQRNIVNYENFYMNNTWRMQGANVDFGLSFKKYIKEINVTGFTTRVNATNFSTIPERLMSGAVIEVVKNSKLRVAFNTNHTYDIKGTIKDTNTFKNSVNSIDASYKSKIGKLPFVLTGEIGRSNFQYSADTNAPNLRDYFAHAKATLNINKYHLKTTLGYINVGPNYRSIGAQSKDVNYNALPIYFDRYTNKQSVRPLGLQDVIANEHIYNRTVSSKLMTENLLFNGVMPFGMATFNRLGMYGQLQYNNHLDVNASYHNLNEINGQGTLALRNFQIVKLNAKVPIQHYLKTKKKFELQFGAQQQLVKRTSAVTVENVDFKNTQATLGLTYELFKDFDLLGGYVLQNSNGVDFAAERNAFSEIIFFNQKRYSVEQNMTAFGAKYNFTPKIYLSGFYQKVGYSDEFHNNADYKNNQFNIIYNMLF
jgi:hypothetical protein